MLTNEEILILRKNYILKNFNYLSPNEKIFCYKDNKFTVKEMGGGSLYKLKVNDKVLYIGYEEETVLENIISFIVKKHFITTY